MSNAITLWHSDNAVYRITTNMKASDDRGYTEILGLKKEKKKNTANERGLSSERRVAVVSVAMTIGQHGIGTRLPAM